MVSVYAISAPVTAKQCLPTEPILIDLADETVEAVSCTMMLGWYTTPVPETNFAILSPACLNSSVAFAIWDIDTQLSVNILILSEKSHLDWAAGCCNLGVDFRPYTMHADEVARDSASLHLI